MLRFSTHFSILPSQYQLDAPASGLTVLDVHSHSKPKKFGFRRFRVVLILKHNLASA